ncbi:phospholipase D-like domain-containing protein [Stenotrophomonas geniculata]|uniref:phospholipase D-like domain-containing protein n=1 Tax=Stenotrophomonas geniculata TaxID=86188 RepID=UPI00287FEC45|nr:phospholipase D-like domain-containing protein [Stenotrophomonas geniculata]WNF12238.1 phospholipase D-like domain-containing protein [Stenotrophomonas geniculata]
MSELRVALPLLRGKRRFHLLKGRPWSVVEQLVLQALVQSPSSVTDLVAESNLPRRVIIEMIVRLMRAGWIQVESTAQGHVFSATAAGARAGLREELPSARKSTKRWIAFFIDQLTGSPFRSYELQAIPRRRLEERPDRSSILVLEPESELGQPEPSELLASLTDEDEEIIGVEPSSQRLSRYYALLTVRNGRLDGLPVREGRLASIILEAANRAKRTTAESPLMSAGPVLRVAAPEATPIISKCVFSHQDIVLGGEAHRSALQSAIAKAHSRVFIHSTFISADGIDFVLPLLKNAAMRGVQADILWGQGDNSDGYRSTLELVGKTKAELAIAGLDSFINLHNFSTHSHAKLLIADDLGRGRFSALVGSCNWLSTGYVSFDATLRCRDPELVGHVMGALARLSQGRDGHWNQLSGELSRFAVSCKNQEKPVGMKVPMAIVTGDAHASFVRKARDEAMERIFVASHRVSEVGKRAVLLPAIAAAQSERDIAARIYFNRTSGGLTPSGASDLIIWSQTEGCTLKAVHDPRLHAKILAWDDDSLVISSQNWLSTDGSHHQSLQEIGVYVCSPRAADNVISVFDNAHVA